MPKGSDLDISNIARKAAFGFTFCLLLLAFILLLLLPRVAYAQCSPPQEGLAGHWKLDETSGTTANDSAGTNNGSLTNFPGTPPWGSGKVGGGLLFDGADDYVDLSATGLATRTYGDLTISVWYKSTNTSPSTDEYIFTVGDPFSGQASVYFAVTDDSGNVGEPRLTLRNPGFTHYFGGINVSDQTWHHLVAVRGSTSIKIYVDGVEKLTTTDINAGEVIDPPTNVAFIGNHTASSRPVDGTLDDIRIYDRAMSAAEVAALYATRSTADAQAGQLAYDTKHARLMYCNGTDWVHAGTGSYNPNAVHFDGTNDSLSTHSGISAAADSTKWSGSFWFRRNSMGAVQEIFDGKPNNLTISFTTSNNLRIEGSDSGGTFVLNVDSTNALTDTADWHHAMFSIDLTDTARRHMYIDGIAETLTVNTYNTAGTIDFTQSDFSIGATNAAGFTFDGGLADFWLDFGTYIDLSVESNRRKFRSTAGMPMYLGKDGSIPTGEAPDIFLSGSTDDWHTNKGAGGGFTENGALTTASTQPGDGIGGAFGLVGHWKLDETAGTVLEDSADTNDGTFSGGASVMYASGQINKAVTFDGNNDFVDLPNVVDLNVTGELTMMAWINWTDTGSWQTILGKPAVDGGHSDPYFQFALQVSNTDFPRAYATHDPGGTTNDRWATSATALTPGWHHVTGTFDPATHRLAVYLDGQETGVDDTTGSGNLASFNTALRLGANGAGNERFQGLMDDVRIYGRLLSPEEINQIYQDGLAGRGGTNCVAPAGTTSEIIYNPDFNVIQYCNGAEWVAMGPIGGTPPADGLVAHWKLDETSATTAVDSAGTNNGTMNGALDAGTDSVAGKISRALNFDDASSQDIEMGDVLDMGTNDWTMAGWFKYEDGDGGWIIAKDQGFRGGYRMGVDWDESVSCYYPEDPTHVTVDTVASYIQNGLWYFAACVYDRDGDLSLYINGNLEGAQSIASGDGLDRTNGLDLKIGNRNQSTNFDYFTGDIDDVRIYDRALSAQEISRLYYYGLSGGLGDLSGNCVNPAGPEAMMLYNRDHNVMQYCNGERWIGIGK